MSLPVGDQVAHSGNFFTRWLGRTALSAMGWRLEGAIPNLPKMVLIGGPHTTNMDGVLGIVSLIALGLKAGTMIKDTAFKGMMGAVLRRVGAIPINRNSPKGVVEQSVDAFENSSRLLLLIAPEGTRRSAAEWKRGYYHIATKAHVPVLPAAANYRRKIVTFGPPLTPTGDYAADFAVLVKFYAEYGVARYPHRLSRPLCEATGQPWVKNPDDR